MDSTFSTLADSVRDKLWRLVCGDVDEITIKRKPSGKVHVETKQETSHEAHEAPGGDTHIRP